MAASHCFQWLIYITDGWTFRKGPLGYLSPFSVLDKGLTPIWNSNFSFIGFKMSQSIVFTCKMLDINAKKFKKQILSSNWGLKHLFAGLNIQHLHKTLLYHSFVCFTKQLGLGECSITPLHFWRLRTKMNDEHVCKYSEWLFNCGF